MLQVILYGRLLWAWLKRHAWWCALFGIGLGSALLKRKESRVSSLKAALSVQKTKGEIDVLESQKDTLLFKDSKDAKHEQELRKRVARIDARIAARKRHIASLHFGINVDALSDEELVAAMREVGL